MYYNVTFKNIHIYIYIYLLHYNYIIYIYNHDTYFVCAIRIKKLIIILFESFDISKYIIFLAFSSFLDINIH